MNHSIKTYSTFNFIGLNTANIVTNFKEKVTQYIKKFYCDFHSLYFSLYLIEIFQNIIIIENLDKTFELKTFSCLDSGPFQIASSGEKSKCCLFDILFCFGILKNPVN